MSDVFRNGVRLPEMRVKTKFDRQWDLTDLVPRIVVPARKTLSYAMRRLKRTAIAVPVLAVWAALMMAPPRLSTDEVQVAPFGILISVLSRTLGSGTGTGGGGAGSTYNYLTPAYTLPTGMTYNAATGMVEGTTIDTTYATHLPAFEVVAGTVGGTRAANYSALSSAISTAAASGSGTRIRTAAGGDYGGNYNLPVNNSSGWIFIETEEIKDGTFISESTRAVAADVVNMPNMYSTATGLSGVVFHLPGGNNKYRFAGLHVAFAPSGVSWFADTSSNANQVNGFITVVDSAGNAYAGTNTALYPADVVVDRCFISGIDGKNLKRALWLNGIRTAIINSTVDEVRNAPASGASDGQALLITSGPGPHKIHNCHFRVAARGENFMVGGGNTGINPADGQVTNCHMEFPVAWHTTLDSKNLSEHKAGIRWLWQGNVFNGYKSTGVGSQYFTINFKTSDDTGAFPLTETRDITFRLNVLRNCSGGWVYAKDPNNNAVDASRMELTCNILEVPTSTYTGVPRSWGFQVDAIQGVIDRHNSIYCTPANGGFAIVYVSATGSSANTHEHRDNFFAMAAGLGVNDWLKEDGGLGGQTGNTCWNVIQTTGVYTGNAISKTTTVPSGNTTCSSLVVADCDSVAGGDLALNPTSPLKGTATAGRDPGAVHSLVNSAINGVV